MKDGHEKIRVTTAGHGAWYLLGMVGSMVYFLQLAHGFWPVVLALLKALVWPAFLTYDVFTFLAH